MSREGKLAKNTLVIALGTFLPKLATFATLPILTACLTKTEYGAYDLVAVLVALFLPAATLQIQAAAFRFLIDVRNDPKAISAIVTNIAVFVTLTSLPALVVLSLVLFGQPASIRIAICLYFFADIAVNAARQVCRGLGDNLDFSISAIVSALGKLVFAVVFVWWLRIGLLGAVYSLFAASFSSLSYILVRTDVVRHIRWRSFDLRKLKEMLAYSWPMVPNSLSAWVMRLSDRVVITFFLGLPANAVFAVACKLPGLLNLAQNTFTLAWQENASIASKDRDAGQYYSTMFRTLFDLMAGFFSVLIASVPLLFALLVRGDYAEAYFHIPILFLAMFFFGMAMYLGGIYVAFLKSKSVGMTTTVAAAINLAVDIGTIKWIGLYAASGSTLVSYLFLFVYRVVDVQKIVRITYSVRHMLAVVALMVLEAALCFLQRPVFNVLNLFLGAGLFLALNHALLGKLFRVLKARFGKKPPREAGENDSPEAGKNLPAGTSAPDEAEESGRARMEPPPVLFDDPAECCGCAACHAVCPVSAIAMVPDGEGFRYPRIDASRCIRCRRCLDACAFKASLHAGKGTGGRAGQG